MTRQDMRPYLFTEDDEDSDDLGEGIELAQEAGPEIAQGIGGIEQRRDEQNTEVARKNEHRHVTRHQRHMGDRKEKRGEQELVRNGIEVLPQPRTLPEPAGNASVERIGDARRDEEREGNTIFMVKNLDDRKRNDEEPHQRKQIGCGAKLLQKRHQMRVRGSCPC